VKLDLSYETAQTLVEHLRATGVPFIIVGGLAVQARLYSATLDVDVMASLEGFQEMIVRLRQDRLFGTPDRRNWLAKYEVRTGPRPDDVTEVDVLNGRRYCGNRTPDEFFEYLRQNWTTDSDLGPSLQVPAVWYTRLMVPDSGDTYVRKVVRDIRAGASRNALDDVLAIARYCGTLEKVSSRVARIHRILEEVEGPASLRRE